MAAACVVLCSEQQVMATPDFFYRWIFSNPITKILFHGTFRKMGFHKVKWCNYEGMDGRSLKTRKKYLEKRETVFCTLISRIDESRSYYLTPSVTFPREP
ncbi:hypothetical protein [Paenibacillus sp. FSL H7-0714]|uniref:hypothetical protein n=1 Tax=Paenibacillus sp. FSL H7-0714 TaxID=2954735 RepID=UPI0030F73922